MPVLTSVVEERVRMAGGEDDDVGAAWAHGEARLTAAKLLRWFSDEDDARTR